MQKAGEVKPYLVEPVLTAAIQNRLHSPDVMLFISRLVQSVSMKVGSLTTPLQRRSLIMELSPSP